MRAASTLVIAGLLTAPAGMADVRISVKSDGKKLIHNVGRPTTGRAADLKWLAKQHDRRSRFDEYIERYCAQFRVDPVLVRAVIQIESNFQPDSLSTAGARGLMQLMPATARRYRVTDPHDPEQGIRGGTQYLSDLLRMFPNDLRRVLAAYNAGEGAVRRHGGIPPYAETKAYVMRGLTVYHGRVPGEGLFFRGRSGGPRLAGGFTSGTRTGRVAVALIPRFKYLGRY